MAIHPLPSFYLEVAVFSPILINPMLINNVRYFIAIAICRAIAYILLKVIFYFRKRLKTQLANIFIYLSYHESVAMSSKISYCTPPLRFVVQISPFLRDFLNIFVFPRHIRHLFKNLYNQFSPLATFQVIFQ